MNEMMADTPFRPAGLTHAVQGLLGEPLPRIEGPSKVTGAATYAYEGTPEGIAYAAIVGAPIGSGSVTAIDASAAEALPGVLAVIHGDARMPAGEANSRALPILASAKIFHVGQPVAIVVPSGEARTLTFQCGMGMYKSKVLIQ